MKMRTGTRGDNTRWLPEQFYIGLLALDGILKRCGFKDAVLFREHNPYFQFNAFIFESGICFNLFSEYGVGKNIEHLIKELLTNAEIDPDNYEKDLFYREIVNLAPELCPIIRQGDPKEEGKWAYKYAIRTLNLSDEISKERFERLHDLLMCVNEDEEINYNEIYEDYCQQKNIETLEDRSFELDICFCSFCMEFRKYNLPREKEINDIIFETLMNIDREINKNEI